MATTTRKTIVRSGSPANQFTFAAKQAFRDGVRDMRFDHAIACMEMSPRRRLKFCKMSDIGRDMYLIRNVTFQAGDYNPFNLISNANATLTSVGSAVSSVAPVMTSVMSEAQTVIASLSEVLSQTKSVLFGVETTGFLIKLLKVIVNTAMARKTMLLASLFFNIMVEFGKDVYNAVVKYFGAGDDYPIVEVEFQGFDFSVLGGISGLIQENQSLCAAGLGTILTTVLLCALGLPQPRSADSVLKFFSDRSRNLKNIFDFGKVAVPLFTAIGAYLLHAACGGLTEESELDEYLSGYNKWATEVVALTTGNPIPYAVRLEKDERLFYTTDRLFKAGVEYSSLLGQKRIGGECSLHFHRCFKLIEDARKLCDYTGVFGNRPRMKPAVFLLFGESGVGKSGMAWPFACDLNMALSDTVEAAKEFSREIYFRNTEQEFWDGYAGQNIVCYDDFGQRADSQAAPNEEFMELIRAANLAPYPLHMAQLEEKKRTKFCSKALILTSNVLTQTVNSLTFPDAYRRRIDMCGKVINKDEYTKEGTSNETGGTVKRLDPLKCDGPVDTRPYLIQIYDPESQQPVCDPLTGRTKVMEYEDFVIEAIRIMKRSHKASQEMNTVLETRITPARFTKLRKILLQGAFDEEDLTETFEDAKEETISWTHFVRSFKNNMRERIKSLMTIQSGLILMGVLLAGLGIWKYFKKTKNTHHRVGSNPSQVIYTEACSSADNTTRRNPVAIVEGEEASFEANCSSDNITRNTKKIMVEAHSVEANCSADNVTRNNKKITVEAFGSGDARSKRMPIHNVEANLDSVVDVELQAWKDATAQDLISHRILSNMYKIHRFRLNEKKPILNGLFIRDTVMLVPRHLSQFFRPGDEIMLENIYGTEFRLPWSKVQIRVIAASTGHYKDAMLLKFPRVVNAHTDLVKHFQTMPETAVRRADVCLPTLRCVNGKTILTILGNTRATMTPLNLDHEGSLFRIRDAIEYTLNTSSGDCGGPIICNENSMIRKIAGIHVAGENSGQRAFGQSVTQADLLRTLMLFDDIIVSDFDNLANFQVVSVNLQSETDYDHESVLDLLAMPAALFGFAGLCSKVPFTPNKTDIRPSIIHGRISEPTTAPSALWDRNTNIMNKNIAKCAVNTPYIDDSEVKRAIAEVRPLLLSGRDERLARVLTYEEAIAGSEDSDFLGPINRASSAGYPWVLERKGGTHGKTGWFGNDQTFIFDETVRDSVNNRILQAKRGIRNPVVWTATLKDERRPIEKVRALKTRVFANGPMDYTIAVRMYFLGFIAHIMENRIQNEQSLGTNPVGYDWTVTAKKLGRFGDKIFAGDFSSFDGTLNSCILSEFVEVVNDFYNDGEENALIRRVLMLDVYNSIWMCEGKFISLSHSQPSGNPLTTALNSFYNSVSMRIAYYRAAQQAGITPPAFNDAVSMVSYGDDNVINFSDSIKDWFNQITVTDAYATFGMTYTDEAKSGDLVAWRKLSEVAYLKRGFRKVGSIYRAPMALETLLETPNWIRQCPDFEMACQMNIEDVCRELAQHPEEIFNKYSQSFISEFYKTTGSYPAVSTYNSYNEEWDREMGLLV
jgi:hypothetical protein